MGRYLVCGLGQVGFRVARLLGQLGQSVTVLSTDARPDFVEVLVPLGVVIKIGDARSEEVLKSVGIEGVDAVIACTDNDLINLEISLDSRQLQPSVRIVARIFDQGLARDLEESGVIDKALSMSILAASSFAGAALGQEVNGAFLWEGRAYGVVRSGDEYSVTENEAAPTGRPPRKRFFHSLGRMWAESPQFLRRMLVIISAFALVSVVIFHLGMGISLLDAVYFVVTTLTTTGYGDIVPTKNGPAIQIFGILMMLLGSAGVATMYSLLTDFVVSYRVRELTGYRTVDESGHIVIAGLGNVGYRVANHLALLKWRLVVLDPDGSSPYSTSLPLSCHFLVGDARDAGHLRRAATQDAVAVIALTDDDSVNLSISIAAREINPNLKIVTRLFDDRFAAKVQNAMKIDSALSASRIAAPVFAGTAMDATAIHHFVDGDRFISIYKTGAGFEASVRRLNAP